MDKVIDLIIGCSNLPLSIIIVGIGNANFDNMDRLDGDAGLFGSKICRDAFGAPRRRLSVPAPWPATGDDIFRSPARVVASHLMPRA